MASAGCVSRTIQMFICSDSVVPFVENDMRTKLKEQSNIQSEIVGLDDLYLPIPN